MKGINLYLSHLYLYRLLNISNFIFFLLFGFIAGIIGTSFNIIIRIKLVNVILVNVIMACINYINKYGILLIKNN
jgi:hypothetical protein